MSSTLEIDEIAELQPAVDAHVRTGRPGRHPYRHVLVVGLIRGGAPQQEDRRRRAVLVEVAGVVVLDLVIVPADDERRRAVRGDEVGIRLVEAVAVAVVDQRIDLVAGVLAHAPLGPAAVGAPLVDVVAGVDDEVELLLGDAPVGGEIAGLEVAAAADAEAQPVDRGPGRRRRSRAPGLTELVPGAKAIPVVVRRLEPVHLDVNAVGQFRPGQGLPFLHDGPERRVRRQLPLDRDGNHRHAAAGQRLGREPGPQDDAVGQRIAGGDAERERVRIEEHRHAALAERFRGTRHGRRAERPRHFHHITPRQPHQRTVVPACRVQHRGEYN